MSDPNVEKEISSLRGTAAFCSAIFVICLLLGFAMPIGWGGMPIILCYIGYCLHKANQLEKQNK